MFKKITNNIVTRLVKNGEITAEDKEIYEYGLRHIANMFINVATTVLIGCIFNMIWHSLIFMISYIPLRSNAGGYHAKTPFRCYIFSVIMTVCFLLNVKYFPQNHILILILILISGITIFILAPIGDENKPLDGIEIKVFKKRTRIILFIEIVLIGLFSLLTLTWIAICIITSMTIASFMVIIGFLIIKINKIKV